MKKKLGEKVTDYTINILLILVIIVTVYPLWFVLIASISDVDAIARGEVVFWPVGLNLGAYKNLFRNSSIWIGYRNTIIYTFFGVIVDLLVQIPCAFVLSRKELPGKRFITTLFVITMYFGGGIIPRYLLINALGWINHPIAVIVPGCISVYNIIVAKSFFQNNVPESLYDAALLDGCSYFRYFLKIVIPLSGAMISIIALYNMQAHWNTYLTAQMYLYEPKYFTLQQVVRNIQSTLTNGLTEQMEDAEYLRRLQEAQLIKYAVVVVSCIPMAIVYPFVQKNFVKGVMVGAVKG